MVNLILLFNGFELVFDVVFWFLGLYLVGKVFKKLMKLKVRFVICGFGCFFIECIFCVVMEEYRRCCSLLDVDVECCYDFDEYSVGFVSVGD